MTRQRRDGNRRWWAFCPVALAFWLLGALPSAQAQTAVRAVSARAPVAGRAAPAWLPTLPSPAVQALAGRVLHSADHGHQPFAIVDKQAALLAVYRADGSLVAVSPALLGRDIGDSSVPGVGDRAQTGRLRPGDATTPGGRFVSSPGRNRAGEAVVWLDFSAAFAIHRLRPGAAQPDRARRLASVNPRDKRISAGCVVVPAAFYLAVVEPTLGHRPATVYVLPESPQGRADWAERAEWADQADPADQANQADGVERQHRSQALARPPAALAPALRTGVPQRISPLPETPGPAV